MSTKTSLSPVIILVQPQMGENIGATARIMSNFDLDDLRIVAPRDGWPNPKADETARNGKFIVDKARIFPSLQEAAADLNQLYAATARPRDMVKPAITPRETAKACQSHIANGSKCGFVFGPERSGLTNQDVAFCDVVVTVPVSETNASLNLGQAVAILSYEWFALQESGLQPKSELDYAQKASKSEISGFFEHLTNVLDKADYFKVPEKRERMLLNIQNMFLRADMTDQDVRTLRGILTILAGR